MRVAYICADRGIPVFGRKGASVHVQSILRAFLRRGDEVDLYAARLGGEAPVELKSVSVHRIGVDEAARGQSGSSDSPRAVDSALGVRLRQSKRHYDLVYERHALWSSSAMEWAQEQGIERILEINAPLVEEQLEHRRLENPALARSIVSRALRAASVCVAVSREVALQHRCYGIDPEAFLVAPNGFDEDRFTSERTGRERTSPQSPFTIGFLGTLKPWHGIDVLLNAFCQLAHCEPRYHLLVVGDGPLGEMIAARLRREALDHRATLTGSVDPAEVPRWLAMMDVGTAPYAKLDGLYFSPLKAVEYMAAGLPVVASRAGQLESLIQDERSGLLVPPGDAEALAHAIERLRRETTFARGMGRAARAHVLAHHTWGAVLERVLCASPSLRGIDANLSLISGDARAQRPSGIERLGHG